MGDAKRFGGRGFRAVDYLSRLMHSELDFSQSEAISIRV